MIEKLKDLAQDCIWLIAFLGTSILTIASALLVTAVALFSSSLVKRHKSGGKLIIDDLSEKLKLTQQDLAEVLTKTSLFSKLSKKFSGQKSANTAQKVDIAYLFVINFRGDMQASAVQSLREIVTAVLLVAKQQDEVLVKIESVGGSVAAYGLAAAQLQRLRDAKIKLTVSIDKVAASGGYLMACVADRIIAAPFAIVGSIGVVFQLPNFSRFLAERNIDFEQITAGHYKRTLTMFGVNTAEGRDKMRAELEAVHQQFQDLITEFRPQVDLAQVATGEYWLAKDACHRALVDELVTSDSYILASSAQKKVLELSYVYKTTWFAKIKGMSLDCLNGILRPFYW